VYSNNITNFPENSLQMVQWLKYGIYNALLGLVIGIFVAIYAIGNGYGMFALAAPIAAFFVSALSWRYIVDKKPLNARIIIAGIISGTFSHYFTFIVVSIFMNLCYWITGGCLDSLGEKPASIFFMFAGSFGFSFFSLLFYGWITVPVSIFIGFLIRKK
jgi:hypothetical protein